MAERSFIAFSVSFPLISASTDVTYCALSTNFPGLYASATHNWVNKWLWRYILLTWSHQGSDLFQPNQLKTTICLLGFFTLIICKVSTYNERFRHRYQLHNSFPLNIICFFIFRRNKEIHVVKSCFASFINKAKIDREVLWIVQERFIKRAGWQENNSTTHKWQAFGYWKSLIEQAVESANISIKYQPMSTAEAYSLLATNRNFQKNGSVSKLERDLRKW